MRTGRKVWEFHTIPQKGEPGYETWLKGSAEYTGNTAFGRKSLRTRKQGWPICRLNHRLRTFMAARGRAPVFMATAWWPSIAAAGVATVLLLLRGERERSAVDEAACGMLAISSAVRMVALLFTGPVVLAGGLGLARADQPVRRLPGRDPAATAFILIYLSGEFLVFKRLSPADLTDVVEAVGAADSSSSASARSSMGDPRSKKKKKKKNDQLPFALSRPLSVS